jgi:hypothetical protein
MLVKNDFVHQDLITSQFTLEVLLPIIYLVKLLAKLLDVDSNSNFGNV